MLNRLPVTNGMERFVGIGMMEVFGYVLIPLYIVIITYQALDVVYWLATGCQVLFKKFPALSYLTLIVRIVHNTPLISP